MDDAFQRSKNVNDRKVCVIDRQGYKDGLLFCIFTSRGLLKRDFLGSMRQTGLLKESIRSVSNESTHAR